MNAIIQVLGFLLIGAVIGVLARFLKPGRQPMGLGLTLILGMAGALIGGLIASFLGTGGITELNFLGFVIAVIAAILLVGVVGGTRGRSSAG